VVPLPLYNGSPLVNPDAERGASDLYYRRVNLLAATVAYASIMMVIVIAQTARAASSPQQVVRGAIDSIRGLPASDGHPEARRKLLDSIDSALALDLVAKNALGPQWDKLSKAERRHFVAVFTESLEKLAFPRAATVLSEVKLTYLGEDKKTTSTEVVKAVIGNDGGGRIPLDFEMVERGARWQIADVLVDGTRISNAVSTRIQNAVANEGYQKMVEELQRQISKPDPVP